MKWFTDLRHQLGAKALVALVAALIGEALVLFGLVFVFTTKDCGAQLAIALVVAFSVPLLTPFLTLLVINGFDTFDVATEADDGAGSARVHTSVVALLGDA